MSTARKKGERRRDAGWAAMTALMPHLIAAPILLPLLAAAAMLLVDERRRAWKAVINVASSALGLAIAVALLVWADRHDAPVAAGVYLPGNWPVPFGIVLALDRLSALMLVLAAGVGLASLLFALARWQHAGVQFHTLFQLQLMGLNGAFLTADLFNLFVFFEVLLAASYGLLLHGTGRARVRAGLHYVAVNLLASSLFLIGVALLYGVAGTLNMADMASKLSQVPAGDRGLLHAGAAILAVALLAKAALWPLNFWLPGAYAAASTPVAALFAVLTKVGVYAVLRLWTLGFPASTTSASVPFGADLLVWGGLATLAFGAVGLLASQHLGRLAAYAVIVSSGTLLAAIGFGQAALTGGALYYLISTTFAASALFLLVELVERARQVEVDRPWADDDAEVDEPLPFFGDAREPPRLPAEDDVSVGRAVPGALAFLGLAFVVCALVVAGLPPMPGFVGKVAMLDALLDTGTAATAGPAPRGWALFALLIGSGLLSAIALSRAGIRYFWAQPERAAPRLRMVECLPVVLLLAACVLLVVQAGPVLRYTRAAADALHRPGLYIDAVMAARPVPAPGRGALEGAPR